MQFRMLGTHGDSRGILTIVASEAFEPIVLLSPWRLWDRLHRLSSQRYNVLARSVMILQGVSRVHSHES
jgi:hypothetical protein